MVRYWYGKEIGDTVPLCHPDPERSEEEGSKTPRGVYPSEPKLRVLTIGKEPKRRFFASLRMTGGAKGSLRMTRGAGLRMTEPRDSESR